MSIFRKMSDITNEISAVAKNLKVGEGRNAYKAAGEADVLAAVKPIEAKFGVYSYPYEREVMHEEFQTVMNSFGKEMNRFWVRLRTTYRFVDVDAEDPEADGNYIDILTYGDGIDSGDKALGKAMTYADKYALMKAYKIITGEDADQYASEDVKIEPAKKRTDKAAKAPSYSPDPGTINDEQLTIFSGWNQTQQEWALAEARKIMEGLDVRKPEDISEAAAAAILRTVDRKRAGKRED